MDAKVMVEVFGYIGSALVVVSMLMSSIVKLRVINTVGSVISAVYALIVGAVPLAVMNVCLIVINVINLCRLLRTRRTYDLVPTDAANEPIRYFLEHYDGDIRQYFPGYSLEAAEGKRVYLACCDGSPAGLLLGEEKEGAFDLVLDYSTPAYRDSSVSRFLYGQLAEKGFASLVYRQPVSSIHASYMLKMGYTEKDGAYTKALK